MDVENFMKVSRMNEADKVRIVESLLEEKVSAQQLADKLGISFGRMRTAYEHLGLYGTQLRGQKLKEQEAELVAKIRELSAQGMSKTQISDKLGVSLGKVRSIFKRYKIVKIEKERVPQHGTVVEYGNGCRCVPCKEANTARCAKMAAERRERQQEAPHGTESGYLNWSCRCAECVEAGRKMNQRRLGTPPETQTRKWERWNPEEVDKLRDYDKLAREHAIALGRTTSSVNIRRKVAGIKKVERN